MPIGFNNPLENLVPDNTKKGKSNVPLPLIFNILFSVALIAVAVHMLWGGWAVVLIFGVYMFLNACIKMRNYKA